MKSYKFDLISEAIFDIGKLSKPLPFNIIAQYVDAASAYTDLIISVGSGTGEIEDFIEKAINKNIICIDPDAENCVDCRYHANTYNKIVKMPDYGYVDDLLLNMSIKDKKITLLLIWPLPGSGNCYDIEAIFKLDPENIIIYYDASGAAGSSYLHYWLGDLKSLYGLYDQSHPIEHKIYKAPTYHKIAEFAYVGCGISGMTHTLCFLNKMKIEMPNLPIEVHTFID